MRDITLDLGKEINLDAVFSEWMVDDRGYGRGHYGIQYGCPLVLALQWGRYTRHFHVGGWTAEGEGRIEFGGPLVQGPQAYMNALGIMITSHEQAPVIELLIEDGSRLYIRGTWYTVNVKDRYGDPIVTLSAD